MKIYEVIQDQKHHSLSPWKTTGHNNQYQFAYDTHGIGRVGERGLTARIFYNIVAYSFLNNIVTEIPRGSSMYIHDLASKCSIVVERLRSYPFRYIIRSAMGPNEPPDYNAIDIQLPKSWTDQPLEHEKFLDLWFQNVGKRAKEQGIDSVSQALEKGEPMIPLNREQRRAIAKAQKKR